MDRVTDLALRFSLLLASIGSLLSLTKMLIEHVTPVRYYWWAGVAFFGATIALAATIRLRERTAVSADRSPVPDPAIDN
ncbi:hypothetical protein [Sphingomonas mucosissima]|uniref:YiaA/B two helix domain protein n=1 Tax=Sphingomonas mucosissima TaxID=370959 RepID=A0A245ZHD1_9SPHN|nr:hypothetical protein [Sphingomonas mucosissima]OWK29152.1 hypothetical protein SPMU_26790 [Sphingomonas mucosissima]